LRHVRHWSSRSSSTGELRCCEAAAAVSRPACRISSTAWMPRSRHEPAGRLRNRRCRPQPLRITWPKPTSISALTGWSPSARPT
jgi:hypothetical protein